LRKLSRVAVTGVAALALSVAAAPAAGAAATSAPPEQSAELRDGITSAGLMEHLQAFQAIADANDDTRAAGTPGYDKSVEYVVERLRAAGYTPSLQSFPFPYYEQTGPSSFERLTPTTTTFVEGTDFDTIQYSGNGTATGAVQAVDVNFADPSVITSGCEATDFAGFTRGNIALIQRGTCEFAVKIQNAEQAGATGVIVFNQGNTPERSGLLTGVTAGFPHDVPVITTSFALGQEGAGRRRHDRALHDADDLGDPAGGERGRRHSARRRRARHRRRRAPRLRRRGPGHQRQRHRLVGDPGDRRADRRGGHPHTRHHPLRVVGRRGGRAGRLGVLRRQPVGRRAAACSPARRRSRTRSSSTCSAGYSGSRWTLATTRRATRSPTST
jgi:hypothetical protein